MTPGTRDPRRISVVAGIFSLLLTVAFTVFYYRVYLHHPLVADDFHYFYEQPPWSLRTGLLYWSPWWGWYFRPVFNNYVSFVITVFHKNPVAVHACGLIVTGITYWLLGTAAYRFKGLTAAVIAPLLFLIAPDKDEAIWWAPAANSLLSGCFYIVTLLCWTLWVQTSQKRWYWLSIATFVLSICSKDDAISLPLALLILDWGLRGKIRLSDRIKTFTPVAVLTVAYLICDKIAYDCAARTDIGSQLFRFEPVQRSMETAHFLFRQMLLDYFNVGALSSTAFWLFFAGIPATLCLARRKPILVALLAIAVLASIPAPLGTGPHSESSRFNFLPGLCIALMYAVYFSEMALSRTPRLQMVAAALAAGFVGPRLTFNQAPDIVVVWIILLVLAGAAFVLWQSSLVDSTTFGLTIAALIVGQTPFIVNVEWSGYLIPALTLIAGSLITARQGAWSGIVALAVMLNNPVFTISLFLIASVVLRKVNPSTINPPSGVLASMEPN